MKLYAANLDFGPVAEEFQVPCEFDPAIHAEAAAAQDRFADQRVDRRDLEFVTIDPVGSKDLDQAVLIQPLDDGYRVFYAIADVAAFVAPDSRIDDESIRRGQTIYLPDGPARLHPEGLSENAASLLPDVDRPAVLWSIDLDHVGEVKQAHVERALVRSRARLNYDGVHQSFQDGTQHPSIALLPAVGRARQESSLRREAINLRVPSVEVVRSDDESGRFELVIEPRYAVMDYNSEISLLCGMVAGRMMVAAGKGLLRTLKPADKGAEEKFRTEARSLGFEVGESIGAFLASVDADTPSGMAVMREAQSLLRGAGYGSVEKGQVEEHAGVGGYYAHVTAPLRRLVDRYATEYCLAICAGRDIPQWVLDHEDEVLESMERTTALANNVDKACLKLTEATVLQPWVGENFDALVLSVSAKGDSARIFLQEPPVLSSTVGAPEEGTTAVVSLIKADPQARKVEFAWPAD